MELQYHLQDIKDRQLVLPEFQREFEWSRQQAKDLLDSLLKEYPTGSLLIWKTPNPPALKNLSRDKVDSRIDVLLDGQQRLTALYLLMRNNKPPYYKRIKSKNDPRNLHYNLKTKELKYYMKIEMESNPFWVSVVDCFADNVKIEKIMEQADPPEDKKLKLMAVLNENLKDLLDLRRYEYSVMRVQEDASLSDALKVFDRVNTGGTPLSESDVALAYMCSNWGSIRRNFKKKLLELEKQNFNFNLRFMVRAINAVINCRANYSSLHELEKDELKNGWNQLDKILDYVITILKNSAYVYSSSDLNTSNVLIPIIGYLAQHNHEFETQAAKNKMIYWLYAALYKRRYSASVDQYLEKDLAQLEQNESIDNLIRVLKEEEGGLEVNPSDLVDRGVGHPLYNMMCFVIRANGAVDWANSLDLSNPYGDSYRIERHHIFPRAVLAKEGYDTGNPDDYNLVHQIANRIPLTKQGNLEIFDRPPAEYFPQVEKKSPGNLEKCLVPQNKKLWEVKNYKLFLKKRRELITEGINQFMESHLISMKIKGLDVKSLIEQGENNKLEFKAGLVSDNQEKGYGLEEAVVKTVAGFLNADGGTLLIGVSDKGKVIGIERNFKNLVKPNRDRFELRLTNLIKGKIGGDSLSLLAIDYETIDDKTVCAVKIGSSPHPAYAKLNGKERLFVRLQNSTRELEGAESANYLNKRFFEK